MKVKIKMGEDTLQIQNYSIYFFMEFQIKVKVKVQRGWSNEGQG